MNADIVIGKARRFELRVANVTWATLRVSEQGLRLEHSLDDVRVAACPGLAIFDENGNELHLNQGSQLFASDSNGLIRLKLNVEDDGTLSDVVDPSGKARVVVELGGPGSAGDSPVEMGGFGLTLKPREVSP